MIVRKGHVNPVKETQKVSAEEGLVGAALGLDAVVLGGLPPPPERGLSQKHSEPFCAHTAVLFFTSRTIFTKLHEMFSTLL